MNELICWKLLPLVLMTVPLLANAQSASSPSSSSSNQTAANSTTAINSNTTLPTIIVTSSAPNRQKFNTSIGTQTYTLTQSDIATIAQGENTSFNQVLVHTPGVSFDTYGAIHFRNEDPYYRYYINGTLLPSGINGFGQDIDTHFVASVTTLVGALPIIRKAIMESPTSPPRAAPTLTEAAPLFTAAVSTRCSPSFLTAGRRMAPISISPAVISTMTLA